MHATPLADDQIPALEGILHGVSARAAPAHRATPEARATPPPPDDPGPSSAAPMRRATDPDDLALVVALRDGDEAAFLLVVDRYHGALLRLARVWVRDSATAEDVVQETWLALIQGIDRFEGRSSLKTWLFGILANQAKRRVRRESRSVPFAALAVGDEDGPSVDPDRFFPPGHRWSGHWSRPPAGGAGAPDVDLLTGEIRARMAEAITALPPRYRAIIILRDVEGRTAEETCNILGVSATNQRVLLHRARSRVRQALEPYLEGEGPSTRGHRRDDLPGVG